MADGLDDKKLLNFDQVMERIVSTLKGAEGDYIAVIHNRLCNGKLKYKGDSLWELEEE